MTSEHLKYLQEVLDHDAIGYGDNYQLPDAIEHFEALEHASEQYRKVMSEQAKRIEQLEAALRKIAQHDLWVIAINALRPGERVPLEGKDGG